MRCTTEWEERRTYDKIWMLMYAVVRAWWRAAPMDRSWAERKADKTGKRRAVPRALMWVVLRAWWRAAPMDTS